MPILESVEKYITEVEEKKSLIKQIAKNFKIKIPSKKELVNILIDGLIEMTQKDIEGIMSAFSMVKESVSLNEGIIDFISGVANKTKMALIIVALLSLFGTGAEAKDKILRILRHT